MFESKHGDLISDFPWGRSRGEHLALPAIEEGVPQSPHKATMVTYTVMLFSDLHPPPSLGSPLPSEDPQL